MLRAEARKLINPETGAHYAFYSAFEALFTQFHDHDFYEIFLITQGRIVHLVNGEQQLLSEGMLVFIRPNDAHSYQKHADDDCQLINLAFTVQTIDALFRYLNPEFTPASLTMPALPPIQTLSQLEKIHVQHRLESLNSFPTHDSPRIRVALRALLAELLNEHFLFREEADEPDIPIWLQEVCILMRQPQHFIEGRSALLRLAQRSEEHVGRNFKRYLGITPSHYINTLRLNYAANLLIHTDRTIMDIMFDAGFGNLSHFYHLFREKWQVSPNEFRKANHKKFIP